MKIGELSTRTGCPVQTIRYYEAEKLLQPPQRNDNNYRSYSQAHVDRLHFIVRCRSLDMAQEEIRALLSLQDEPSRSCDEVDSLLETHLRHVSSRITALQALKKQIQAIRATCAGGSVIGECGAVESLKRATGANDVAHLHSHVRGVHR
jgi:Cd(II)/Pb(II)-responsive transcriptional regulator